MQTNSPILTPVSKQRITANGAVFRGLLRYRLIIVYFRWNRQIQFLWLGNIFLLTQRKDLAHPFSAWLFHFSIVMTILRAYSETCSSGLIFFFPILRPPSFAYLKYSR